MSDSTPDERTFTLTLSDVPVLQSSLLAMSQFDELAMPNIEKLATDLLTRISLAQSHAIDREEDTPLGPGDQSPRVEVDLDETRALAAANALLLVSQSTEGPLEGPLNQTTTAFIQQIPDEWREDSLLEDMDI